MKKILLGMITLLFFADVIAQDNPRPTRSRFWKAKESTFHLKAGDILVYKVTEDDKTYDMIVRVKKFGNTINYDFEMPTKDVKANVNIQAAAVTDATAYSKSFTNGNMDHKNINTVWVSKSNYADLAADGEATMDFGDGKETFTKGNTGTLKINYKGKQKIITLYNVHNASGNKTFGVLTEDNNPLIVTMNMGWKMTLKEVR